MTSALRSQKSWVHFNSSLPCVLRVRLILQFAFDRPDIMFTDQHRSEVLYAVLHIPCDARII